MKDERERTADEPRRPYAKPEIFCFPLRPEEAVLGFCKMTTSAGPGALGCRRLGANCNSPGS